ncbi:hypothetical protein K469DRAFT_85567 [Zopfia rhizophila CBS 207.26]|uniref:Uncharacterized protein n=1 Tax=Zopfia rhizophila CBS 207.26 TaxID=1314779 RepID=A0A6A6ED54_9PEZI|nr:hypothetical protein K469DRAFT_85567 [Zopfia rhizophila CBS 207.26]
MELAVVMWAAAKFLMWIRQGIVIGCILKPCICWGSGRTRDWRDLFSESIRRQDRLRVHAAKKTVKA